jgi:hypothetical protein
MSGASKPPLLIRFAWLALARPNKTAADMIDVVFMILIFHK